VKLFPFYFPSGQHILFSLINIHTQRIKPELDPGYISICIIKERVYTEPVYDQGSDTGELNIMIKSIEYF